MSRIFAALIRHADYQQLADTPSAHQPFPLTEKGITQAASLALELRRQCRQLDCQIHPLIASSRLLRAWQTADTLIHSLNELSLQITEHTELAERCVGSAANLSSAQIQQIIDRDPRYAPLPANWKSNSHFCLPFPGAESLLDAGLRVAKLVSTEMQALQQTSQANQLKIFVGHGAAFRHAAYHLGILKFEQIAQLSMFHCHPVIIEYLGGSWHHVGGSWKVRASNSQFKD